MYGFYPYATVSYAGLLATSSPVVATADTHDLPRKRYQPFYNPDEKKISKALQEQWDQKRLDKEKLRKQISDLYYGVEEQPALQEEVAETLEKYVVQAPVDEQISTFAALDYDSILGDIGDLKLLVLAYEQMLLLQDEEDAIILLA